jgi:hypothetical protein
MKYIKTVVFLFGVQFLISADSMNIAQYSRPFVHYTGLLPMSYDYQPDTSKMNPWKLLDENYFTFLEFPASGQGNIGSSFGIELPSPRKISSVVICGLGNAPFSWNLRLQGYKVSVANDTTLWHVVAEGENLDSAAARVYINTPDKWKFVKTEITSQSIVHSTVISELKVFALLDSGKAITSITLSAPQYTNGESTIRIQWTTASITPTENVNVYFKLISDPVFIPLALNTANDGIFDWNTTLIRDGMYTVKIEPSGGGEIQSLEKSFTLENYRQLTFQYGQGHQPTNTNISYFYSSAFIPDSLEFLWSYASQISKYRTYRVLFSSDSGKQWETIGMINDSSIKQFRWKVPEMNNTIMYARFVFEMYIDTVCVARVFLTPPRIVMGGWSFGEVSWCNATHNVTGSSGSIASFKSLQNPQEKIVLGQPWIVMPNGDTLSDPFWNRDRKVNFLAVSDINNDGESDIITSKVISESGTLLFYDTTSSLGINPVVADFQGDGYKEIIYHYGSTLWVVSHEGKKQRSITVPGPSSKITTASVADINNDLQKEIVFGVAESNVVHAFDQNSNSIDGFPIVTPDVIRSSPIIADLYGTGDNVIVVACKNNIHCYDKTGKMLDGFPFFIAHTVSEKPVSIADVDNDGYLDIIFSAADSFGPADQRKTSIYCIDRFGSCLPGWPVMISDTYPYVIKEYSASFESYKFTPVTISGALSSPYILSIDGDWKNEVIFFSSNGLMYVFDNQGNLKSGFPVFIGAYPDVNAHFGDFDNDGTLNAVIPVVYKNIVYMMSLDFGTGSFNSNRMPWPTYRQNVERTGIAPQPVPLGVNDKNVILPAEFALFQNYPNPFNPNTTISFSLPQKEKVILKVFDILGRDIATLADEQLDPGIHHRKFSSIRINSGIYYYTLRAGNISQTKKMLLIK